MTNVQIEAGTLTANEADRIVSGLLLPYGEECRSNLGKFSVDSGAFSLPADVPNVMGLNLEHDREQPIGRTLTAHETPQGIYGTFQIAKTAEGDELLASYTENKPDAPRKLSIEVANVVIRAGKAVAGRVFGAAIVKAGAFPSATLMAADVGDETDGGATTEEHLEETFTDENGVTWTRVVDTETEVEDNKTTTTTTVVEETIKPDEEPVEEEEEAVGTATAPSTLNASKTTAPKAMSFLGLTRMLARAKDTGEHSLFATIAKEEEAGSSLFAALNDIKFDTTGAAGVAITAVPQWLGEIWTGRAFQRRIIPLISSAALTSLKIAGWRWVDKPEVGPWAGNKAAVPSNTPTTEAYDVVARRLAGAHDIAREYRDFNVPGFWEGYFRGMTESYDRQADEGTLEDLLAAATAVERGTTPTDVNPGMVSIVDGALAILDDALPSFAVVAKDIYRDLLLSRDDDKLAYLNGALGLEEGTIASFRVIPHKDMTAGTVLVGAKDAATSYELAGVPIRVEGLDMVKGGIDPGVFGYYGTVIHSEAALALVSPPAAAG